MFHFHMPLEIVSSASLIITFKATMLFGFPTVSAPMANKGMHLFEYF